MILSKTPAYKKYGHALFNKEYDKAEAALQTCIDLAIKDDQKQALCLLTQFKGDIYFFKGDIEKALACYVETEQIDDSPLTKYYFAIFLAEKLKRYDQAIDKCEEAVRMARANPGPEIVGFDFSSNQYLATCYAFQGHCYCCLKDFKKAGKSLLQLLELKEEKIFDAGYAVQFCDQMISRGQLVNKAKEYLRSLLRDLVESSQAKECAEFIAEIENILKKETTF